MSAIYTIGHSNQPLGEFIEALRVNRIERLIDVRSYPGSRACPWFGGEALSESLPASDIAYEWQPALGGRRKPSKIVRPAVAWWEHPSFAAYAAHALESAEWSSALERLMAQPGPVAIMCAEVQWWKCHRRIISDWLVANGTEVRHIMGAHSEPVRHELSAGARMSHTIRRLTAVTYPQQGETK